MCVIRLFDKRMLWRFLADPKGRQGRADGDQRRQWGQHQQQDWAQERETPPPPHAASTSATTTATSSSADPPSLCLPPAATATHARARGPGEGDRWMLMVRYGQVFLYSHPCILGCVLQLGCSRACEQLHYPAFWEGDCVKTFLWGRPLNCADNLSLPLNTTVMGGGGGL